MTNYRYLMALCYNTDNGLIDTLPHDVLTRGLHFLNGFKSEVYDPDSSRYHQAMQGNHREYYNDAMKEEIRQLDEHGTWEEMYRSQVP